MGRPRIGAPVQSASAPPASRTTTSPGATSHSLKRNSFAKTCALPSATRQILRPTLPHSRWRAPSPSKRRPSAPPGGTLPTKRGGARAASTDVAGPLERVENVIHVEVKKLYPDAELPSFECTREGPDRVVMVYRSPRRLSDLAAGLIEGCAEHYGEALDVTRDDLSGDGQIVRFTITRGTTA